VIARCAVCARLGAGEERVELLPGMFVHRATVWPAGSRPGRPSEPRGPLAPDVGPARLGSHRLSA
jgi:hypothetical protein